MLKWTDIIKFTEQGNPLIDQKIQRSNEQWKNQLTHEQFHVTRNQGTERAFSSELCQLFEEGAYACVCCDSLLFDADEKFDSGTGWPSFTQPAADNAVAYRADNAHGMIRIEAVCNVCEAHLGHVFPDGPEPSGLRYCMNAVSLKKVQQHD